MRYEDFYHEHAMSGHSPEECKAYATYQVEHSYRSDKVFAEYLRQQREEHDRRYKEAAKAETIWLILITAVTAAAIACIPFVINYL